MTDTTTPTPAPAPQVEFQDDKFKVLMGFDSDEAGNIRMRCAYTERGVTANGATEDLSDPAAFMAWWIVQNWDHLRSIAAGEYNVRQSLAMVSKGSEFTLVTPQGGTITQ